MNRQRQREREIQRQREGQQNNDMTTESVVLMSLWSHAINILISNWSRTRKFSRSFKNTSRRQKRKTEAFHFSHPSHALVTLYVHFLCCDWSKFERWVHAENLCSILKLVYFDSWSLQSFFVNLWCFLLSFSTGCIKWNTAAINSLLLFMAGLFIEFLVEKCAACQSRKSDFGWHRFRFSPCWMRVEKSLKRFWPYLIAFRSCISNGKPE